jgi:hypothetical protein
MSSWRPESEYTINRIVSTRPWAYKPCGPTARSVTAKSTANRSNLIAQSCLPQSKGKSYLEVM